MATFVEPPIPLKEEQRSAPILVTAQPVLQVRGLVKRYGPKIVAVDHVDIEAYPGEVLGIVGESGSGKSTVLRCSTSKSSRMRVNTA